MILNATATAREAQQCGQHQHRQPSQPEHRVQPLGPGRVNLHMFYLRQFRSSPRNASSAAGERFWLQSQKHRVADFVKPIQHVRQFAPLFELLERLVAGNESKLATSGFCFRRDSISATSSLLASSFRNRLNCGIPENLLRKCLKIFQHHINSGRQAEGNSNHSNTEQAADGRCRQPLKCQGKGMKMMREPSAHAVSSP